MTKIRTGHIVAGLVGAGVSAALASRPTAARISEHNKELDQIEARYAERKAQLETSIAIGQDQSKKIEDRTRRDAMRQIRSTSSVTPPTSVPQGY